MNPEENITANIAAAADVIRDGGIVAFPTETYYGLAVDPFNAKALQRLFRIKRRPVAKPILTLISTADQLSSLVAEIPAPFIPLMDQYWPGPLTLVFPALAELPVPLTAGTGTVGVRISSHPAAQALVQAALAPVTATSANISGCPPAVNVVELRKQFGGELDMIVDVGDVPGGAGSTVLGCDRDGLVMLRPGVVYFDW